MDIKTEFIVTKFYEVDGFEISATKHGSRPISEYRVKNHITIDELKIFSWYQLEGRLRKVYPKCEIILVREVIIHKFSKNLNKKIK